MCYPAGEKEWGRGGSKTKRVVAVEKISVQKIACMVKRHNEHYQTTQQVNGVNTGFGNCHAAKIEIRGNGWQSLECLIFFVLLRQSCFQRSLPRLYFFLLRLER